MDLQSEIKNWDKKSTDKIQAIYDHYSNENGFINKLIRLTEKPELQIGSTWLLKYHLEHGESINATQTKKLLSCLKKMERWEVKLHLLQCLPFLTIAKENKQELEIFVRLCLQQSNKFVRAWAYNGLYEIAKQYPEDMEEALKLIELASKDEAPSVKARIRNIRKEISKNHKG